MDKWNNNALASIMIQNEASQVMKYMPHLFEALDDKPFTSSEIKKLPKQSFLWIVDPKKKSTWHLPYRYGEGGINPKTGMFNKAGRVNRTALLAIASAVAGKRSGITLNLPNEIKKKLKNILKKNNMSVEKVEGVQMPYPNFHAARLRNPDDFANDTMRITKGGTVYGGKKVPASINVIWGKLKGKTSGSDPVIPQALRFNKSTWTSTASKDWLSKNKINYISFEKAEGEQEQMEIKDTNLIESYFGNTDKKIIHDTEKCVVKNMAILAPTSRNCSVSGGRGRVYTQRARESVAMLINKAKAYIDHASREELQKNGGVRSMRDLLGFYENGRLDENGIVRADLSYLDSHKDWFSPIVEKMADKIGGSIHAFGPTSYNKSDQLEYVEDIKFLGSADLVTETGSTKNLNESLNKEEDLEENMKYDEITLNDLRDARPDLIEAIVNEINKSTEVVESIKSLKDELESVNKENENLKKQIDEFAVKEALVNKKALVDSKLKESGLPAEAITESFVKSLVKETEETVIDEMIADRKKLIEQANNTGVKDMGDSKTLDESNNVKDIKKDYESILV